MLIVCVNPQDNLMAHIDLYNVILRIESKYVNHVMSRYKILCQLDRYIISNTRHGPDMSITPISISLGHLFDPGVEQR